MVSAYSLDERVQAFGIEKGKLVCRRLTLDDQPAQLGKPMALRLDVHTGELSGWEGNPVDVLDRRVAAIADALDAETLDELEALWRRQKGIPSGEGRQKAEIEPWEQGELVYWDEVFEVDRLETFLDSGRRVAALDMYCVNPSCDCREVSIAFNEELLPGERAVPSSIGLVVVSPGGELRFEPKTPNSEARLRGLWARYRRRHPGLRVAFERYDAIRAFAAAYVAPRATLLRSNSNVVTPVSASPPVSAPAPFRLLTSGPRDEKKPRGWVSTSRKRNKARR